MSEKRYDTGELRKPVKLPNGWLRVDGLLTRTGVFTYVNPDGSLRYELRLPEEVFAREAMDSFQLVAVTDEHPDEFLTAENTRKHARGAAGEMVVRDGDFVRASLMITDAELIAKMEDGEARELSCGYTCDLEEKAGIFEGLPFTHIQRRIRGNHVAVVPRGRAGPAARVRMDAAAAAMLSIAPGGGPAPGASPQTQQPKEATVKVRIGRIDVEAKDDANGRLLEAAIADHADALGKKDAEIADLRKQVEATQAKADAAEEKAKKLDAELKAAPEKVRADLKARLELEQQARSVLGAKTKLDGLTDREVREKVLAKLAPTLKLEGRADAYVDARFELALEQHADEADEEGREDELDRARRAVDAPDEEEEEQEDAPDEEEEEEEGKKFGKKKDSVDAYEAMRRHNRNLWKTGTK